MPIYDYVCGDCGHRFEVLHGLNEDGPHRCPLCGGAVSRVFAPPTIVFKGSGWARVDRRTGSSSRRTTEAEASDAASSPAGSGDAAPSSAKAGSTKAAES